MGLAGFLDSIGPKDVSLNTNSVAQGQICLCEQRAVPGGNLTRTLAKRKDLTCLHLPAPKESDLIFVQGSRGLQALDIQMPCMGAKVNFM